MRVYYSCTLYEDLDSDIVPTDKAKIIAKFEIVIQQDPQPPANQYED
jgi:hypothetical protein